ncbi:MAG: glutaminyl-peptide cyclotransferase [Anaerolineaceae bacterium]|nr:glutaminyl-peptide cyclotransferase [Anaerolineaceae bacterium]
MKALLYTCLLLTLTLHVPVTLAEEDSEAGSWTLLQVEVLATYPHDPMAFTQGLLWHDGYLYESIGRYGHSALRQVDLESGEVMRDEETGQLKEISLRHLPVFAEGLALAGGRLYQLTWREEVALHYNLDFFTEGAAFQYGALPYEGEGWGLCYDGEALVMSDGSATLVRRDPKDFSLLEELPVTLEGAPLSEFVSYDEQVLPLSERESGLVYAQLELLNELECVEGLVYANVWLSELILVIDGASGEVRSIIDASGLLPMEEQAEADVLNGIAWLPERETFLLTGKLWPTLFEVRLVPVEGAEADDS